MNRLVLIAVLVAACASPTGGPPVTPTLQVTSGPPTSAPDTPTAVPPSAAVAPTTAAATPTAQPTGGPLGIVIALDPTGTFLVTPDNFSLYTFDNDSPGESACSGNCAGTWPPFPTGGLNLTGGAGVTGTFAEIARADGITQVTYNDAPLYFYSGDAAAGDTNGNGIGGVWHLATP